MMRIFGLTGYPLGHSWSARYFAGKFARENIQHTTYNLFPLENINGLKRLFDANPDLIGLNVTIPHKKTVIPLLHSLSDVAKETGAVNCIKKTEEGSLHGYNTDAIGFERVLNKKYGFHFEKALLLGTGGSSQAVQYVLRKHRIHYQLVSRNASDYAVAYSSLNPSMIHACDLIINTTPLGMYPNIEECPDIPWKGAHENQLYFDLIYNPLKTEWLKRAENAGAKTENGLAMLELQAEASWAIWNNP